MSEDSSNNRRIAKNTILLYFRMLFLMLVNLYTSRVVLRELGVDDYGIYAIVGGVVTMFSLLSGSMSSAISRFITFELGKGDAGRLKTIFSSAITIQLIFSAIILVVGEPLGLWFLNNKMVIPPDRLGAANWCFQLSLITFIINNISIPYNATIIAHERMSFYAYVSIYEGLGQLLISFLIVFGFFDKLVFYASLIAILAISVRVIYGWYCKRHFEEANYSFVFDKRVIKEMFSFAGWNLFGQGSLVLRNHGVDILLNLYFGVVVNAAKGICNQVQSAVYQFVTNFQTALSPQLTMSIAQNDYARNHTLVIQGSRFSFYLLTFFSIPFLLQTQELLALWLGKVPDYTVVFVQWTFIYLQLDCLSRCLIKSILAYGKIRNYQILVGGTKLLVLPIVWVVLYWGGHPVTGVVVNVIIELFCLAMRIFFNNRYTHLPVNRFVFGVFAHCWVVFGIIWLLVSLCKMYITDNFVVGLAVDFIVTAVIIWLVGLRKTERASIASAAMKIIKRR